jgi:hypothetical protein
MNKKKLRKGLIQGTAAVFLLFAAAGVTGCQKDNSLVDAKLETGAIDDAAQSVADAVGMDEGGALDQVGDILEIATDQGLAPDPLILKGRFAGRGVTSVDKNYDSLSGWWTVNLMRTRGENGALPYAEIYRSYQFQYINKDGSFQKTWKVANASGGFDTAYAIHHKILSGGGINKNLRGSRNLLSLSGEWMVTGVNTNTVTINTYNGGSYVKTGADTLKTRDAVRTLTHTITLNFSNVTGPRGDKLNLADKTSGTITGVYHAVITFQKGELYKDKTIDKDINITLGGGKGRAFFDIGGRRFWADIFSGEILP